MHHIPAPWIIGLAQIMVMEPPVEAPEFTPEDEAYLLSIHITLK